MNSWGSAAGLRGAKGYVYEGGIRVPLLLQWPRAVAAPALLRTPVHFWDLLPTLCAAAGVEPPASLGLDGANLLPLLPLHPPHAARHAAAGSPTAAAPQLAAAEAGGVVVGEAAAAAAGGAGLRRGTPLWWAMHRGRGGMQYAIREGHWKLLATYVGAGEGAGGGAGAGAGAVPAGEVTSWLSHARLGAPELYALKADPQERVNLAAARPRLAARLLRRLQRLVRAAARDGPAVSGWTQRPPPCPRWNPQLNVSEHCCQPLPAADG